MVPVELSIRIIMIMLMFVIKMFIKKYIDSNNNVFNDSVIQKLIELPLVTVIIMMILLWMMIIIIMICNSNNNSNGNKARIIMI